MASFAAFTAASEKDRRSTLHDWTTAMPHKAAAPRAMTCWNLGCWTTALEQLRSPQRSCKPTSPPGETVSSGLGANGERGIAWARTFTPYFCVRILPDDSIAPTPSLNHWDMADLARMSGEVRAIKVIAKPSCLDELQTVSNEVYALLQLDHLNIAKLFEYFEDKGSIYVVTELCEGGNIGELDPMEDDSDEIRLLFRDVARAIAYCHSEGIAHRDLKFDNCLLAHCNDRRLGRMAKVIDFGLAGFLQAGVPGEGELEGVVGTLYFLAPEVLKSTDPLNSYGLECDLWSFGVMLFVVLTNEHPFCSTASGPEDAYRRIANGCLRLSCLRNAGALAIEAEDLLRSLLVKEPLNRCSAAEALVHPWLQPELETPASLVERISSFSRFSKFEQAILTVAAHEAKPKDVEERGSQAVGGSRVEGGWISRDDLRRALKICDVRLSKMETDAVLDCLDADQDGKIQHTDFLAATLKPAHVKSEKVLEELFNFFDFQGTGHITHEDLKAVLGQDLACHVAVQARANAQGVISQENFRAFILKEARLCSARR
ncbi:unnamed protein product [Durusdinium trenchii]|uniref:Non-specific serine/threonine protein kinase n=1 Tax=Durusdinium trenchii TaxID=1381693 RepID=A0ABP0NC73_9DINO